MNIVQAFLVFGAIAVASTASFAQFVKGNEAVKAMPDGSRHVETPPIPGPVLGKPCPAALAGCAGGGWLMVEANDGLVECTEIYARPGTCRKSTYGNEKRLRLWIVKSKSQWLQCQYPDLTRTCVSTKSLPIAVAQ
jgi:hypothetical protein